ncbi:class I SAM-dependent methyltransferase [Bdellovibrionota bacterium FG-2]
MSELVFDSHDPFPLFPLDHHAYADAQIHSEQVDAWLGFETSPVESGLASPSLDQQFWQHLPPRSFQTPYTEIRQILHVLDPKPGSTLIDLGAGYGRMAFVVSRHYPEVRFIGYEAVEARVRESQRVLEQWPVLNAQMVCVDLSRPEFVLPFAENYFVFDFGSRQDVSKTLDDLKQLSARGMLSVVARGRLSRHLIDQEHPWLAQVVPPRHFAQFSIYASA